MFFSFLRVVRWSWIFTINTRSLRCMVFLKITLNTTLNLLLVQSWTKFTLFQLNVCRHIPLNIAPLSCWFGNWSWDFLYWYIWFRAERDLYSWVLATFQRFLFWICNAFRFWIGVWHTTLILLALFITIDGLLLLKIRAQPSQWRLLDIWVLASILLVLHLLRLRTVTVIIINLFQSVSRMILNRLRAGRFIINMFKSVSRIWHFMKHYLLLCNIIRRLRAWLRLFA